MLPIYGSKGDALAGRGREITWLGDQQNLGVKTWQPIKRKVRP